MSVVLIFVSKAEYCILKSINHSIHVVNEPNVLIKAKTAQSMEK